jgi:hypothetical protein
MCSIGASGGGVGEALLHRAAGSGRSEGEYRGEPLQPHVRRAVAGARACPLPGRRAGRVPAPPPAEGLAVPRHGPRARTRWIEESRVAVPVARCRSGATGRAEVLGPGAVGGRRPYARTPHEFVAAHCGRGPACGTYAVRGVRSVCAGDARRTRGSGLRVGARRGQAGAGAGRDCGSRMSGRTKRSGGAGDDRTDERPAAGPARSRAGPRARRAARPTGLLMRVTRFVRRGPASAWPSLREAGARACAGDGPPRRSAQADAAAPLTPRPTATGGRAAGTRASSRRAVDAWP